MDMVMKPSPPTDLQRTLDRIRTLDQAMLAEVQARLNCQTKPQGSLGRLEEFARQFVAVSGREDIRRKVIFTCPTGPFRCFARCSSTTSPAT